MAQQWFGVVAAATPSLTQVPHIAHVGSTLWRHQHQPSTVPSTTGPFNYFSQLTTRPIHSRAVGTPILSNTINNETSSLFAHTFIGQPNTTATTTTTSHTSPNFRRSIFTATTPSTNSTTTRPFISSSPFTNNNHINTRDFTSNHTTFIAATHPTFESNGTSTATASAVLEDVDAGDDLLAAIGAAHDARGQEIANDSEGTLMEDLRKLNTDTDTTTTRPLTPTESLARTLAASLLPPGQALITQSLHSSSSSSSTSSTIRQRSRSNSPARKTPNISEALSMSPDLLVHTFTSTEPELENQARLAQRQQREQNTLSGRDYDSDGDELNDDLSVAPESPEPLINEIVGWLTEVNQGSARKKEKQALVTMPHDIQGFFHDTGRHQDHGNWTTLLRVCAAKGLYEDGLKHWEHMNQLGLVGDSKTYTALITLCSIPSSDPAVNAERLKRAWQFLEEFKSKNNGRSDESHFNILAVVAGNVGTLEDALNVLHVMKKHQIEPTHVIYTELINICRKTRTPEAFAQAEQFFNLMRKHGGRIEPDTMTYTVMIRTASEAGSAETAIALFDEMREKKYAPDASTYGALIHACSKSATFYPLTFEYFDDFLKQGFRPSLRIYNTLLHACACNGDVANGLQLWSLMDKGGLQKDEFSYNTMLNVIATSMKVDEVRKFTAKPNESTIVTGPTEPTDPKMEMKLLPKEAKLDKEERIKMSHDLFTQMKQANIPISLHTLNAMVKVMAVAGRLQRVLQLQTTLFSLYPHIKMDFRSYQMIFTMYLEACRYQLALDQIDLMHQAGLKGVRSMYQTFLHKLSKPHKKMSIAQLESFGQQVLAHMKKDGVPIRPEDERFFHPELYRAHQQEQTEARLKADTIKTGPAHSYSQREDAMIRLPKNRTGSGRTGHQKDRFEKDPKLAIYKQKRSQREADAKEKMQGGRPKQTREYQESLGHYYSNSSLPQPARY